MKTDYTSKENKTINDAWSSVLYLAERINGATYRLNEALKYEKKDRTSIHIAKVLMAEEFLKGYMKHKEAEVASLWGVSRGCMEAHLFGAYVNHSKWGSDSRYLDLCNRAVGACQAASDAHDAYIKRMMDNLANHN